WVTSFSEDTPEQLIYAIQPHALVKGSDYRPEQVAGRGCVESAGGRVVILPLERGCSTTAIIGFIRGDAVKEGKV
ncbi:MAG: bifunctional heptose 7-phosphate kinase/heptose 1-phosphate adenyltransferase, partial [Methylococcaceae bacterium]|nr:bifunctional heptose 7-phosphate kinase/heptose 1-phosphate adenyltransferase [Methylococcaceae bacterium]